MVNDRPSRLSEPELAQAAPRPTSGAEILLGAAVFSAPTGWAFDLALSYGLTYTALDARSKASLWLVALASALLSLFSLVVGWYGLRRSGSSGKLDVAQRERVRFLSLLACGEGVFFLVAVLARCVPTLVLSLGGRS
jgi:hypothetical protein